MEMLVFLLFVYSSAAGLFGWLAYVHTGPPHYRKKVHPVRRVFIVATTAAFWPYFLLWDIVMMLNKDDHHG